MKKIFMSMIAIAMAVSASAQVYVGGTVGFGSVKTGSNDAKNTYKIAPEIGYQINDLWSAGVAFGFAKGDCDFQKTGTYINSDHVTTGNDATTDPITKFVNPYVRYKFAKVGPVDFNAEMEFTYAHTNNLGSNIEVGLRPVIAFNLNQHFSLISKIGFIGYKDYKPKDETPTNVKSNEFGLDLNATNIQFGI